MSEDDAFTPRLGRIRDRHAAPVSARLRQALARRGAKATKSGFSGKRLGAGGAALTRGSRLDRMPALRRRRVIVKVHIARARGTGAKALKSSRALKAVRTHLSYLQRDGTDRTGARGALYDRREDRLTGEAFIARSEGDRHQFRLIVSPEDGAALDDLKPLTRALMDRVESDTGCRLDWVAVDHHNTGHPHTHIVIRGRDGRGRDVVIARRYLTEGIRQAAQEIVTDRLGPRRDREIIRARQSEITQDRFTGIDRHIERQTPDGGTGGPETLRLTHTDSPAARFDRALQRQRLGHLQTLGLAAETGPDRWTLRAGWQETLRTLGRKGDVIRTLAALEGAAGRSKPRVRFAGPETLGRGPVTGTVLATGPEDELRDARFLLVEDFEGLVWHVPAGAVDKAFPPPPGSVVDIAARRAEVPASDRVIAAIAARSGGAWSDALHAEADPSASAGFRQAHKRRLEALRRAGFVTRRADGSFAVGSDYLDKAAAHEAARGGGVALTVRSWLGLETQIGHDGETWLDRAGEDGVVAGTRLDAALAARRAFLRQAGHLGDETAWLSAEQRLALREGERRRALARLSDASGRAAVAAGIGRRLSGTLEGHVDLGSGRMAIIGTDRTVALVAWTPSLGRQLGRGVTVTPTVSGVSWTIGMPRQRGPAR